MCYSDLEDCANVTIDLTSSLTGPRGVENAVRRLGAERLVFGSNCYSMSRVARISALDVVEEREQQRLVDDAAGKADAFGEADQVR